MHSKTKRSLSELIFDYSNVLLMLVLVAITFYPLLYIVSASLSDPTLLAQHRGLLATPLGFSIDAYIRVIQNPSIVTGYRNTIFYVGAGTAIDVTLTTLGAFVLSRRNVLWKEPILFLIIFTMFFSGGLIPTYLLVSRSLGWVNSPLALIIPGAIQTYNLIIMRTAFQEVPYELEEAAKIDGANDFQVLVQVYLPLIKPVLAVMILFYAVGHWNSFFPALIYLRDRNLYPLQLFLREILIQNQTDSMTTTTATGDVQMVAETVKYATIVVVTLPILVVYPFLQRYFVKGVLIGGIKG
ncbi:MAG TPA: carbohydrate ABC transporter permease [Aggregatilineales bacterium]|nr:carbohydrate ABC transporter permease [Aggregatilineales bacterium]